MNTKVFTDIPEETIVTPWTVNRGLLMKNKPL